MKLMYGVRMAGPHIIVTVNLLSAQINKFTCDSERLVQRIYSYLQEAKNLLLSGTRSTADLRGGVTPETA